MRQLDRGQTDIAVMDALLGGRSLSGGAQAVLERARALECDPLVALLHATGEEPDALYARAAALFGFAYVGDIAPFIQPFAPDADIDRFGSLSVVRGHWRGQEVVFVAPRFNLLVRLIGRGEGTRKIVLTSPRAMTDAVATVNAYRLAQEAVQTTVRHYPNGSANVGVSKGHRYGLVAIMLAIVMAALFAQTSAQILVLPVLGFVLVAPSALRFWAALTARENVPLKPDRLLSDAQLPVYSVLVPLRDEAHMVPQLARALSRLDYPPEKLDVKFVVESNSPRTIMAVKRYLADARFSLVVVPRMPPHTKPKALNFALPLARGAYVTVFDAEDVPEKEQLRKAASLFAERDDIACLQAQLLITNTHKHWLARLFAAEYAGQFGLLLPAIARLGLPMPLGGTSNHFRIDILRRAGAWDAFNVTEDADLGTRYARLGHTIACLASYTSEESTLSVTAWLRQRSRWMKGWMQTLIVHASAPRRLLKDLGLGKMLGFLLMVGGMVFSISVHGVLLLTTLFHALLDVLRFGVLGPTIWASLAVLSIGYIGTVLVSIIGLVRTGRRDLGVWLVLLPAYWLLAWLATVVAVYELIRRPHHWAKTHHVGQQGSAKPNKTG